MVYLALEGSCGHKDSEAWKFAKFVYSALMWQEHVWHQIHMKHADEMAAEGMQIQHRYPHPSQCFYLSCSPLPRVLLVYLCWCCPALYISTKTLPDILCAHSWPDNNTSVSASSALQSHDATASKGFHMELVQFEWCLQERIVTTTVYDRFVWWMKLVGISLRALSPHQKQGKLCLTWSAKGAALYDDTKVLGDEDLQRL